MTSAIGEDLQARLEAVRRAADAEMRRSPAAAAALLAARAQRLARPIAFIAEEERDALDLLVCRVGEESLALPLTAIVAVTRPSAIARLPRAVAPVHGVTAWRGRPLTVLSLSVAAPTHGDQTRLVVLGSGSRAALAVMVDAVDDVHRVGRATLTAAGPGPRRRYALGVTPGGLLVVDGAALLHVETFAS
jgi:chemotaxis signal transduction protein